MRLPSPKTLIAVISFVAVLCVAVVDFGRTSPGPIIAAHARVDGLSNESGCADCHGGWTSTMTESCLDCHDVIGDHIKGNYGLHGTLPELAAQNCASCHSEHHGETFQAVNDVSFARAGVPDRLAFEHQLIGFDMAGTHLELECSECHEHVDATTVPEGQHRYLGLHKRCVTCHEDVHEGAMTTECAVCHTQNTFEEHVMVGHDSFLPLVGAHGEVGCRDCHAEGDPHSLEALRGPSALRPEPRDCRDCHDQPHADSFVREAAIANGLRAPMALQGHAANALCSSCHEPEHTSFAEDAAGLTDEEHLASGFPLDVPHDDVDCASCHAPEAPYGERYPGRRANDCAACHEDPHAGQFAGLVFDAVSDAFAGGAVDEQGCLVCHAGTHFEPHLFTVEAHVATDLPLEGAHLDATCEACHDLGADEVRTFHPVDHHCDACHGDAHGGFFDAVLAAVEAPAPEHGDCARCHDPHAFSMDAGEEFDHAFWTGHELVGAHAVAACTSCHERTEEPDATGRRFGRVAEIYGPVTGCASCHDDVHESLFDRDGPFATVEGREGCARCHSTTSFRELPNGFDHGHWTGWHLLGAHAEAACTTCHAPLRRPDEAGRTWGRAAGRGCASCHASPHADQFDAVAGLSAKACETCHQSAAAFADLSFDHDLESRFPLDEAHESVACGECHKPSEDDGVVVYRPLSRECVDCHGVHEKALRKRQRRRR